MSNPVEQVPVSAVSLKLPPLWTEQPKAIRTQEDNFLPNEVLPRHGIFTSRDHRQRTRHRAIPTVIKSLRNIEIAPQPIVRHG